MSSKRTVAILAGGNGGQQGALTYWDGSGMRKGRLERRDGTNEIGLCFMTL